MSEIKKKKNYKKKPEEKPKPSPYKIKEMADTETGEIREVKELEEGAVAYFPKSEEEKKKEAEQEAYRYYVRKTQFVQLNRLLSNICGKLKQGEFHCFVKTLPYIGFKDQPISVPVKKKKKNDDIEIEVVTTTKATATKLYEFWGVHKSTGIRYLNKFIELGLFEEIPSNTRTKHYKAKGELFFKGENKIDDFTAKVFQEKLREVIEKVEEEVEKMKKKKRKDLDLYPLAVLGALMPFFHFQTYFAVKNFDEKIEVPEGKQLVDVLLENDKCLKHLKKTEVWRYATGSTVKASPNQLRIFQMNLEILHKSGAVLTKTGNKSVFLIHPDLMFVSPEIRDIDYYKHCKNDFMQTK
ncbi:MULTISPECIES: hypothetical protein [Bacillus cereus group]|uniref:hypothetical protein n=1 Tax=Bacillus cereus group TaxID=86661 RepID=UPI0010150E05|nr:MULTISPECIES: hypothetical protein [Bacillus cereus group]MCU5201648.1 hypothetical protein [Bacillus paranthracis]MCU5374674.1 hypothetical protein [Bacillus pacificus]GCF76353.1 hypothetical protein BC2926_38940 [Bacillus cereus]